MEFKVTATGRNGEFLWCEGFKFNRRVVKNGRKYWRCNTCKSTCITEGNGFVKEPAEHADCIADATDQKLETMKADMRHRASHEPTAIKRIYNEFAPEVLQNEELAAKFPRYDSIQSSLYRARKKTQPNLPHNLEDLVIPEQHRMTKDNQRFLLVDTGPGPDRIVLFATEDSLRLLSRAIKLWLDGTFKSTPDIFGQTFAIHTMPFDSIMVPLIYGLLPDKRQATYERVLDLLRQEMGVRNLPFNVMRFCCDFEEGLRNALRSRFPGCTLEGCFFHLGQCLHRTVKRLGLQRAYNANGGDNELRRYVRRHAALALIPVEQVVDVLHQIRQQRPVDDEEDEQLIAFDDYFSQQWMQAMPPNTWNHFNNVGPRTNNHLEGYHRKLNNEFNRSHPSIYRLIGILQNHEVEYRVKIALAVAGNQPPKRNTKYVQIDTRINNLQQQYTQGLRTAFELCCALAYYNAI
jgi:hypothetical protein